MSISSRGYTSSFRGSNPPGAYFVVYPTDFSTGSLAPVVGDVSLGLAGAYAILAYSGITGSAAAGTKITGGNIGTAPTMSISNFPPSQVVLPGIIDNANAAAARTAGLAAYTAYAALSFTDLGTLANLSTSGNGGTNVYFAGRFSSPDSMTMPTGIVLDAQGNPNAVFIFKAGSTINLASGQSVVLINGAQASNVIWLVGSSLTTVATSNMVGTILAYASITLGGGTLVGRALAVGGGNGAVTISSTTVISTGLTGGTVSYQNSLPLVPAESTADYVLIVANTGSQWKTQKSVLYARPNGTTETAGIVIDGVDCIQPVYPGTSTVVTAGFNPASYMELNGYLFQATTTGTTAANFIGFSAFNLAKGATTTDGTVVWTSFGKAVIVRIRFANVSITAATPVAQEYDVWEA